MSGTEPRITFLIGGVQKAGTTALAQYLSLHPQLELPSNKEAHVFDAPEFDATRDRMHIDGTYAASFIQPDSGRMRGDATPIYILHETLLRRIASYNPRMRWIVLLRDPVERALSQHAMERQRGDESWPAWAALMLERWRLRGHHDDWSPASPLRHWSYRLRGDYALQLNRLWQHFPRAQTLLIRNTELLGDHSAVLSRVCEFLEVGDFAPAPPATIAFQGTSPPVSWLTRAVARGCLQREQREYRQL